MADTMQSRPRIGVAGTQRPVGVAPAGPRPGVYQADVENQMAGERTAGGQPKFISDGNGWMLNPDNPDNSWQARDAAYKMPVTVEPHRAAPAATSPAQPAPRPAAPARPAMAPDPSKQAPAIGVPSPGQVGFLAVSPTGPAPKQAPTFATTADMRNVMVGNLQTEMQAAYAAGDTAKLSHLFAQRAALDSGGFAGHAQYMADHGMNEAKLAQLGARTNQLDSKGRVDLDKLRADILLKSGDEAQADKAVQNARISMARKEAEKTGQPVKVDPNDAEAILAQNYPYFNERYFRTGSDGRPTMGLADIFHNLKAAAPELMGDPGSEFSQAAAHRIRQMYGEDLQRELDVPESVSLLVNALKGHYFEFNPWAAMERKRPAVDWYNSISRPSGSSIR